jgi:spermidine synthase
MWLKKTGSPKALLPILFVLTSAFALFSCRRSLVRLTVMTSGYAGMAMELSLLLLFQVIYGYVYLRVCLFVTLFLVGSALGALMSHRISRSERWQVLGADALLVILSLVAWMAAQAGVHWKAPLALLLMHYAVIPCLIFFVAFCSGCQFSAASRIIVGTGAEITGRLYVADLAGAACGTILTGLLFLPKIGITGVLLSVGLLKGLSLSLNMVFSGKG